MLLHLMKALLKVANTVLYTLNAMLKEVIFA